MHWNIYTTDAQNFLLHVLVLHGFLHQGVFTVVKVVLWTWSTVCTPVTHLHTDLEILCTCCIYILVHVRLVS
jgi:hypothetical protein